MDDHYSDIELDYDELDRIELNGPTGRRLQYSIKSKTIITIDDDGTETTIGLAEYKAPEANVDRIPGVVLIAAKGLPGADPLWPAHFESSGLLETHGVVSFFAGTPEEIELHVMAPCLGAPPEMFASPPPVSKRP